MRAPLDKIEWVDNYLTGKLTASEQQDFLKALETDTELKQLLDVQKMIIETAQRKALKGEIARTIRRVDFWNRLWKWGLGGLLVIVIIAVILLKHNATPVKEVIQTAVPVKEEVKAVNDSSAFITTTPAAPVTPTTVSAPVITTAMQVKNDSLPAVPPVNSQNKNEMINFHGLQTWVEPTVQTFTVDASKGAAIEGKEGTLVIVPANAFVDGNGTTVTGEVIVELVEALTLEDMVLYNLGTTSDGKPLQTGGMLHFDFKSKGNSVNIDPKRPLYIKVPTSKAEKEMMVFNGEVSDGKINWKNPKPLKKYLTNVDFESLDFLPEGFAQKVKSLLPNEGAAEVTNALVDSLYYSIEYCRKAAYRRIFNQKSKGPVMPGEIENSKLFQTTSGENECCGIDPLAIQTIKTKPYSKTFLATKEFAKRVRALHKLEKGNDLLSVYVENLSKNLSEVDSMVALQINNNNKTIFEEFAAEKLTNIKDAQIYQEQLNAYYDKKKSELKQALERIKTELSSKKNSELSRLRVSLKKNSLEGVTPLPKSIPATTYDFNWASYGWVNIDSYLHLLEKKGAQEVIVKVTKAEGTTEVYQWIKSMNNLTPLTMENNTAKAYFPVKGNSGAMGTERTFCMAIGRKDGKYCWFDKEYNPYLTKEIDAELMPSTLPEIKARLQKYNVKNDLDARLDDVEKMVNQEFGARQNRNGKGGTGINMIFIEFGKTNKTVERRRLLKEAAFPCSRQEISGGSKK